MHSICAIWVPFYYLKLRLWIFLGFPFYLEKVDPDSLKEKKNYDKNQEYNENITGIFVHICQAKFNTDLIFAIHTLVF